MRVNWYNVHTFAYPCKEVACYANSIGLHRDYNQNSMANNDPCAVVQLVRTILVENWMFVVIEMVAVAMVHWLVMERCRTYHLVAADSMVKDLACSDDMCLDRLFVDNKLVDKVANSTCPVDVDCMVHSKLVDMLDSAFDA